jgi:hypothetical protein
VNTADYFDIAALSAGRASAFLETAAALRYTCSET